MSQTKPQSEEERHNSRLAFVHVALEVKRIERSLVNAKARLAETAEDLAPIDENVVVRIEAKHGVVLRRVPVQSGRWEWRSDPVKLDY